MESHHVASSQLGRINDVVLASYAYVMDGSPRATVEFGTWIDWGILNFIISWLESILYC